MKRQEKEERKKGKIVIVRFGKIWIKDKWWFWNEKEKILKNKEEKRREIKKRIQWK